MNSRSNAQLTGIALAMYVVICCASAARADFIIKTNDRISRITDDGALVRNFNFASLRLEDSGAHPLLTELGGVGPDGAVYVVFNTPTMQGSIIRFNPNSGEPIDSIDAPFTDSARLGGTLGFRDFTFGPTGDLFLMGGNNGTSIHRLDTDTGRLKSTLTLQSQYGYSNIALRAPRSVTLPYDTEVFVTEGYGGLSAFLSSSIDAAAPGAPTPFISSPTLAYGPSFSRTMHFGSDGMLYYRSDGNVIYQLDVDAIKIKEFIPRIANPHAQSAVSAGGNIEFGLDNDLYLVLSGHVGPGLGTYASTTFRFDGNTGAAKGNAFPLLPASVGYVRELAYLQIPEPSAALISATATFALALISRRRPARAHDANRVTR